MMQDKLQGQSGGQGRCAGQGPPKGEEGRQAEGALTPRPS